MSTRANRTVLKECTRLFATFFSFMAAVAGGCLGWVPKVGVATPNGHVPNLAPTTKATMVESFRV